MDDSDSSGLSSPPSEMEEVVAAPKKTLKLIKGKLTFGTPEVTPLPAATPEPETPPESPHEKTPPHEYALADNPDIPLLVMFRSRFSDGFPKNVPNLGPQDIETGVVGGEPSQQVENFLCALLGLLLNRKKPVERGHHSRALEEAIHSQKHQWPKSWDGVNPLHGGNSFTSMNPSQRLDLLKTLMQWSLNSSEVVGNMIKDSYKQTRRDDDINQPLSVQPWGTDGKKRKYWLIEGQNDTAFRLYMENNPKLINRTWWSVAGTLDELRNVAEKLQSEGSQAGRRLADRIMLALPRLIETEERRKRKDYRQQQKARFSRPEPGFSLYEGRTRGKRMKYTFSDDEDDDEDSDAGGGRSTRISNRATSAEQQETVTASGRHVKSRYGRSYGVGIKDEQSVIESDLDRNGRPQRGTRLMNGRNNTNGYSEDEEVEEDGQDWEGKDIANEDKFDLSEGEDDDAEEDTSGTGSEDSLMNEQPESLVVTLKYGEARGADLPKPGSISGDANMEKKNVTEGSTADSKPGVALPSTSSLANGSTTETGSTDGKTVKILTPRSTELSLPTPAGSIEAEPNRGINGTPHPTSTDCTQPRPDSPTKLPFHTQNPSSTGMTSRLNGVSKANTFGHKQESRGDSAFGKPSVHEQVSDATVSLQHSSTGIQHER